MSAGETEEAGGRVFHYALPDWGSMDTVWRRSLPFVLWKVGEQPLIFHWLDHAVNAGAEKVVFYAADRPAEVRRSMAEATLWPIPWEVRPVANPEAQAVDAVVDHLPDFPTPPKPYDGWSLLAYWHSLEQAWLARFAAGSADLKLDLAVGRGCWIHPTARLIKPYWLADHVFVGPRCQIGPGAVLGEGAMVDEGARVERAHLFDRTYLGQETDLEDALMQGGTLFSLKHRARVDSLEGFIAAGPGEKELQQPAEISWAERWLAWRLWWHWRRARPTKDASSSTFEDLNGKVWKHAKGGLAFARRNWLQKVWQGQMHLFGPTPRPAKLPEGAPAEWLEILRQAPVGVFSYADVMGAIPGSFEDWLHSVYMVNDKGGQTEMLCWQWARELLSMPVERWLEESPE